MSSKRETQNGTNSDSYNLGSVNPAFDNTPNTNGTDIPMVHGTQYPQTSIPQHQQFAAASMQQYQQSMIIPYNSTSSMSPDRAYMKVCILYLNTKSANYTTV